MPIPQHPCFPAASRPIELLGLKGPYILAVAVLFLGDFLLFILCYCAGLAPFACIALALGTGAAAWAGAITLSKRFGQHGLSKRLAARHLPKGIRLDSRQAFLHLQKNQS